MYELIRKPSENPWVLRANDLDVGQLAKVIEDGPFKDHIILRLYSHIGSLTNPEKTWSEPQYLTLKVRLLRPGEEVTLRVK